MRESVKLMIEMPKDIYELIRDYHKIGSGYSNITYIFNGNLWDIGTAIKNGTLPNEYQAEDSISRNLAIQRMKQNVEEVEKDVECLRECGCELTNEEFQKKLMDDCVFTLRAIPSVYPEGDKPSGEWIPVNDPYTELPKKDLWVTRSDNGNLWVDRTYYDMTEWSDYIGDVVAYMEYKEPAPYRKEQADE